MFSLRGFYRAVTALLVAVLLFAFLPGCAGTMWEEPAAEVVLQDPPSFGIISNITPAAMLGREIRRGDIAITVDLEDGRVITVVQPEDDTYVAGDRVRVVRSGEKFSRVQLYHSLP